MAFIIKQNATRPRFRVPLTQNIGEDDEGPIDLTDATTVTFQMRPAGGGVATVDALADIVDAETGVVQYEWDVADTADSGEFEAEVEIVWSDGGIEVVPNDSYWDVTIVDDIA